MPGKIMYEYYLQKFYFEGIEYVFGKNVVTYLTRCRYEFL